MPEYKKYFIKKMLKKTLIDLSNKELRKLDGVITLTNGTIFGSLLGTAVLSNIYSDFNFGFAVSLLSIEVVVNLIFRVKKRLVYRSAENISQKIVSEIITPYELAENSFNFINWAKDSIKTEEIDYWNGKSEFVIPVDYEVLDDNGNSVFDKCNLLIQYGSDVAYPGWENDVQIVNDILSSFQNSNSNEDRVWCGALIQQMEKTMFTKAYDFYNGNLAR